MVQGEWYQSTGGVVLGYRGSGTSCLRGVERKGISCLRGREGHYLPADAHIGTRGPSAPPRGPLRVPEWG